MRRLRIFTALVLALALLVAACGRAARVATPRATATPTATATPLPIATPIHPPTAPLAWQQHTLPVPFPTSSYSPNAGPLPGLALTQADGNTAYECAPDAKSNAVHIWLTRDGGAHWSRSGDIATTSPASKCTLVADDLDPSILAADVYYPHPNYCCLPGPDLVVASRNAGQTWAPLNGPFDIVSQLATWRGVTYALFHPHPVGADQLIIAFVMSRDGLHTWQKAQGPLGAFVVHFWINPYDGRMLAETSTGWMDDTGFWTSPGPGQVWHSVSALPFGIEGYDTVVQQPYTAAPWIICGADPANWYIDGKHNTHTHDVVCTTDSGASWQTIHLDEATDANDQPEYALLAVTNDGSVLLQSASGIARMVPPSARLEPLGTSPGAGAMAYCAGAGVGMLWSGPFLGYSDPLGRIYTVAYA